MGNNLININEALNKIQQTYPIFKRITADLNSMLGISFGYMKVFECGSYYTIQDDLDCLVKFVSNVEKSSIFCERNVTSSFDGDVYNFTLWPSIPNGMAMEMFLQHNIWNGITISKINENYTELYYFTGGTTRSDWHKFFIRNKPLLLKFIKYFDGYKGVLSLDENNIKQEMFRFSKGFDSTLSKSEYIKEELPTIKKLITRLDLDPILIDTIHSETNLSKREIEVLSIICHGYTMKLTAQRLNLSTKTVESYIDRIKYKTGLRLKTDLIKLYEKHFYQI